MKKARIALFLFCVNFFVCTYAQNNTAIHLNSVDQTVHYIDHNAQSKNANLIALENLSRIVGIETDQDLVSIIGKFSLFPDSEKIDSSLAKKLIEEESIYKWSGLFQEFIDLADILFEDFSPVKKQEFKKQFESFYNNFEIIVTAPLHKK